VVLGLILGLCGFNIWNVLAYFKDEILLVFAAISPETMIPRSMEKLERPDCNKEVIGLVMPTGFAFNMDGTAIYMTIGILFLARAMNMRLTVTEQFTTLLAMRFTSKGAAGITASGFVALAARLPAVNFVPVGSLSLLLGVDRFMAEIRAATNLTSDVIAPPGLSPDGSMRFGAILPVARLSRSRTSAVWKTHLDLPRGPTITTYLLECMRLRRPGPAIEPPDLGRGAPNA
jgi:Na+/H+-dicarboxylate symporter